MIRKYLTFVGCCLLLFSLCAGWGRAESWSMRVVFFDCGKADSALLQTADGAVLIDAGTEQAGPDLVSKLRALGVESLDALMISHPHKDHIGGADHILQAFPVERVYVGPLQVDSKQVRQFRQVMEEQGKEEILLSAGETLSLAGMEIGCLGPLLIWAEDENDLSLVLRVRHGETVFLFPGDAEREALDVLMVSPREADLLCAQVLKVPHHGGAERNSLDFFLRVSPEIAVIPCSRDPEDGLPEGEVLRALSSLSALVYVTGDGDVEVRSDGARVWVHTPASPSN